MSALGCRYDDLAIQLDIAPKTLRKQFRSELDRGAIEANAKVVQSLFEMGTSGKNIDASIFWAKTRCDFREKAREYEASSEPPQFVVKLH